MAGMLEYKCPCCDGAIKFDSTTQKMKCPYCDTEFEVDALKGYDDDLKDQKPSEMNWATPGGSWAEGETAGLHTYVCKSCGGEIVGDDTMAASACPFCGNPIVLTGQFAGDLRPDLIVGDFDSAPQPKTEHETIVLPHVKDDTDTQYAAHWLLEHGYDEITLLGALGGARPEHTLANLATGLYLAKNGVNVLLADERSELRYLVPGRELILQRRDWKYLSLFPMEGRLTGVSIRGAFYPLENAVLTADYPLGVSNEFIADTAQLQCSGGCGLVVLTRDDA